MGSAFSQNRRTMCRSPRAASNTDRASRTTCGARLLQNKNVENDNETLFFLTAVKREARQGFKGRPTPFLETGTQVASHVDGNADMGWTPPSAAKVPMALAAFVAHVLFAT